MLALGHQAVFVAFASWIAAKALLLRILSAALVGDAPHGLRWIPDFADTDDFRFGLGRMDNVYYAILCAVALGGVGLSLQAAANVTEGMGPTPGRSLARAVRPVVSLVALLAVFAVMLFTPVGVFLFLNLRAVDAELARLSGIRRGLETELDDARTPGDQERLRAKLHELTIRRRTVKKQTLLPTRRRSFLTLLGVCVLLLLTLPLSVTAIGRAGERDHFITDVVCTLSGNAAHSAR